MGVASFLGLEFARESSGELFDLDAIFCGKKNKNIDCHDETSRQIIATSPDLTPKGS